MTLTIAPPARTKPRIDPARPWVLAALALLAAGANMPSPLYPGYQQLFGFTDLTLTAVYAVYALVSAPALLLLGPLGDRVSARLVLRLGVALAVVGSLCLALATDTVWLLAGRAAYGLALGAVTGVGMAVVARSARRAGTVGAGAVAFTLGSAAGPAVTGMLAQFGPAPLALPFVVQLGLLAVVFVGLRRVGMPAGSTAGALTTGDARHERPALPPAVRRALLVAATNGFLGWTVIGMFLGLISSVVERSLGGGAALAGAVAGALFVCSALATPVLRRLGPRRAQLVGLFAMIGPLAILASGATSIAAILAACVLAGLAHGLLYGGAAETASALAPAERASGITAAVYGAFNVGVGLPTLVTGLATAVVPLTAAMSVMACAALLLCLGLIRPTVRMGPAARPSPVQVERLHDVWACSIFDSIGSEMPVRTPAGATSPGSPATLTMGSSLRRT